MDERIPSVLDLKPNCFRWLDYYDVNSLYPKESPGGVPVWNRNLDELR